MSDSKPLPPRPSTAALFFYSALTFNFLLAGNAVAVTDTELQQERATLKTYEQRIPSLLTQMRSLDRQLEQLQEQRQTLEQDLADLTHAYLTKQKAHEQAKANAVLIDDKNAQAQLEHARFQYYLVERKLTNLQNEAEQLDKEIAPLKQSLRDKQVQLQKNEERLAYQKKHVRKLASAPPTTAERIEIRSSTRKAATQPELQANSAAAAAASVPSGSTLAVASDSTELEIVAAQSPQHDNEDAIAKDRRYASTQAQHLQKLLANTQPGKSAGAQSKTLEVQHKGTAGVKHFYDFAYAGANRYTTQGTVHAGKQVFKVAKQRWITNIPAYDDGASYVFILNATPHRRLELIMYNAALVE